MTNLPATFNDDEPTEPGPTLYRTLTEATRAYEALCGRLEIAANSLQGMSADNRRALCAVLAIELRRVGDASHEYARKIELQRRHTKGYP